MFKGFLSGIFWGTMVGGLVLAVLSLYAPLPQKQMQQTEALPETVAPESVPETQDAPGAEESLDPEENEAEAPVDDSQSGALEPEVVTQEPAVQVAEAIDTQAPLESTTIVAQEEPVQPSETVASQVAEIDPEDVVTAAEDVSAQLSQPETIEPVEIAVAPVVDTDVASIVTPDLGDNTIRLPRIGDTTVTSPKLPNAVVIVDRSGADLVEPTPANPVKEPPVVALNEAPEELTVAGIAQSSPAPRIVQVQEGVASRFAPLLGAPEIGELTPGSVENPVVIRVAAPAERKRIKLPQVGTNDVVDVSADTPLGVPIEPVLNPLEQSGIKVVTGRLPTITRNSTTPVVQTSVTTAPVITNDPLVDFASKFETNAQSLFSVVVIDAGDAGVPREQLLNSSYPITVAIDPTAPNAAALMQAYRDAGKEVVALINDLPLDAAPSDVAVAVEGYLNVLPQVVAIMDPLDGRLRDNGDLLRPVLGAIENSGQGLLTYSKGLNIARQNAQRAGVPSALAFRVLDQEGERAAKIKRYLKRAAFNAGRDGSVVVIGHSYSETMTALLEWALEQNDSSMALAPLSAVLKADSARGS